MYLSPINIPQDNDPATGGVVGCIIMFNMAMACHAKGLSANQSKSSSWLTKAKKIYALSYGLTESEGMETVHNFLVPSILNNIGMVEKRLNPFSNEASKEYFEHLLAFLVLWQGTHTLSPQRLEGCLSNMIVELNILSGPITAPVA